jgi:hypothetical protein
MLTLGKSPAVFYLFLINWQKGAFLAPFLVHTTKNLALQVSASNMSEASLRKLISGGK